MVVRLYSVFKPCNIDQNASKDSFLVPKLLIVIEWIGEYRPDYYRRPRLNSRWHGRVFNFKDSLIRVTTRRGFVCKITRVREKYPLPHLWHTHRRARADECAIIFVIIL